MDMDDARYESHINTLEPEDSDHNNEMRVPWRTVAIAFILIATGFAVALSVIATVQDADVLSTVALALSVLAFSSQLIIYAAQVQATNQQVLQAERVNTETRSMLTEMRTTTRSLDSTFSGQFNRVLDHILSESVADAVEDVTDTEEPPTGIDLDVLKETLETSLRKYLTAETSRSFPRLPERPPRPSFQPRQRAISETAHQEIETLDTYPSEAEGGHFLSVLKSLTPGEKKALHQFGTWERRRLPNGESTLRKMNLSSPGVAGLLSKDLIEQASLENVGTFGRLTDDGRQVARFLTARGAHPDWLKGEL